MGEKIQKRISASGLMSRRAAEQAILSGRVILNGRTARIGDRAEPEDVILVDGKPLPEQEEKVYILLHKPRGYVTTLADERGRHTVAEIVASSTGRTGCRSGAIVRPRFTPRTCVNSALTVAGIRASSNAQQSMYFTRHRRRFTVCRDTPERTSASRSWSMSAWVSSATAAWPNRSRNIRTSMIAFMDVLENRINDL